jgi:hypothetical protein
MLPPSDAFTLGVPVLFAMCNGQNHATIFQLFQPITQMLAFPFSHAHHAFPTMTNTHSRSRNKLILLPARNENNESPDPTVAGHRRANTRSLHAPSRATKRISRLVLATTTTDS